MAFKRPLNSLLKRHLKGLSMVLQMPCLLKTVKKATLAVWTKRSEVHSMVLLYSQLDELNMNSTWAECDNVSVCMFATIMIVCVPRTVCVASYTS